MRQAFARREVDGSEAEIVFEIWQPDPVGVALGTGYQVFHSSQLKKVFEEIYVWEVFNPIVGPALERYGFAPCTQTEPWGEISHGWKFTHAAVAPR